MQNFFQFATIRIGGVGVQKSLTLKKCKFCPQFTEISGLPVQAGRRGRYHTRIQIEIVDMPEVVAIEWVVAIAVGGLLLGLAIGWGLSRIGGGKSKVAELTEACLLYTSPSPRDGLLSRMPSSA